MDGTNAKLAIEITGPRAGVELAVGVDVDAGTAVGDGVDDGVMDAVFVAVGVGDDVGEEDADADGELVNMGGCDGVNVALGVMDGVDEGTGVGIIASVTRTGPVAEVLDVLPLPNCPEVLSPQQYSGPAMVRVHAD